MSDDADITERNCRRCCRWEFEGDGAQFRHTQVPPNFPTSLDSDLAFNDYPSGREVTNNYVLGRRMSFMWLLMGVKAAIHNRMHFDWSIGITEVYLQVLGVADWMIRRVTQNFHKLDEGEMEIKIDDSNEPWPKIWLAGYDMSIFVETPLHLIFHGILADIVEVLHSFMSDHRLMTKFENQVNSDLSDILMLRLEWCKNWSP